MKHPLCFIALLFVVSACEDLGVISQQMHEADIMESVLRFQFTTNGSGYVWNGIVSEEIRFFALAGAELNPSDFRVQRYFDLDASFTRRFAGLPRPVRNYSQLRRELGGPFFDIETGGQVLLFWVGPVRWVGSDRVEAEGGYHAGGRNAEGDLFYLSLRNGSWQVDSLRCRWAA